MALGWRLSGNKIPSAGEDAERRVPEHRVGTAGGSSESRKQNRGVLSKPTTGTNPKEVKVRRRVTFARPGPGQHGPGGRRWTRPGPQGGKGAGAVAAAGTDPRAWGRASEARRVAPLRGRSSGVRVLREPRGLPV